MINRELQTVSLVTFQTGLDEYGQPRQLGYVTEDIEMMMKIYSQTNVSDVRFTDVEMIGITREKNISTENQIIWNGKKYNILYVIPSGRYTQVLMRLNK